MVAFGSWQNSLNSLPSGKMSCNFFWGRTPISPAMRFWAFHARSVPSALKRNTSCPDNFEHVSMILSSSQSKASCKKSLANLSQTFTNVVPSSLCTGNLALSVPVISASNSVAIASQKHCVISTCRNLGVWQSNGGILHWSLPLYPQATAFPSLRRSTVWLMPAETWVYVWNFWVNYPQTSSAREQALNKSVPSPNPQGTKTRITVPGTRQ